jgi:hypothetical protein
MRKQILPYSVLLLGVAACVDGDSLQVNNPNSPDVARTYATAGLTESVIGGLGVTLNNTQRANESINTQAAVLAGENFAVVANFGMASRSATPRGIISNEVANDNAAGNIANWNSFHITARTAANSLNAVDALLKDNKTIGSPARDARARSFGYFILAQAMGYLSLGYDSVGAVKPGLPIDSIPELVGAKEANAMAMTFYDSAITIASSPNATNGKDGFPLPTTWINGQTLNQADYLRMVRSYRARVRAGVARTPAERAAVDWAAIIADATNGIAVDFTVGLGNSSGWSAQYTTSQMYTKDWSQLPMYYYGMADVSGGFDNWLATAPGARSAFLVVTPDKRWPAGLTRTAQQAVNSNNNLPAGQYFRNRPSGEDSPVVGSGDTFYSHRRFGFIQTNSTSGPYVDLSKTEVDMLAAEGYLRTGNIPAAAALIDLSRIRNGLSSVTGVTSLTEPISTDSTSCVPRVPQPPTFKTAACGTIWEAMKYEKRMETAFTGYLVWYADNRGWGDNLIGTVVEWPVPYAEMQARLKPFYNGLNKAPIGTYGY